MATIPRFYVYALARPVKTKNKIDWRVFYIGKGSKRRVFKHEEQARRGCTCYKCNTIRKVWRDGGEIQRYILMATDDEQEALAYEITMIDLYGRENLCNLVDGGGGAPRPSESTRAKMRASHLGKRLSDATRAKMVERVRRQALDPEWRRRVSEGTKRGQAKNPDFHRRHMETLQERYADPVYRAKHAKAIGDALKTPKARASMREAQNKRYSDPEVRAQQAERCRALHTPALRAKTGARAKELWADPEHRRMRMTAMGADWVYTIRSPDGQIFTTESINAFSKEHGLNAGHMSAVARGEEVAHKGWIVTRQKRE